MSTLQLMSLSRKVQKEPGGGRFLPNVRHLYSTFKGSGGAYTTNIGFGSMLICTDPLEFVKVLQSEGKHPEGLVSVIAQAIFPRMPHIRSILPAPALYGRDDNWLHLRRFLQKGLLSPGSARGHLQSISKAANFASLAACNYADDFGFFLSRCAFDAFSAVLLGDYMRTAESDPSVDSANIRYMNNVLAMNRELLNAWEPTKAVCANMVGYKTVWIRDVADSVQQTMTHTADVVDSFVNTMERGELSEDQQHSYLASALNRQQEGGAMDAKDLKEIAWTLLVTSVDTTSSLLGPAILNLALNPAVQQRLALELHEHLGGEGIREDMVAGKAPGLEYLNAVLRECHRTRPGLGPVVHFKRPVQDLELHGYHIPRETLVGFDSHSVQNDPDIVPDAERFRPERWLPEEVSARKGTPAQVIDHGLLSKPFSSGARVCPAARVANIEAQCIIARLVMDWQFELADPSIATIEHLTSVPFQVGLFDPFPKLRITPRSL